MKQLCRPESKDWSQVHAHTCVRAYVRAHVCACVCVCEIGGLGPGLLRVRFRQRDPPACLESGPLKGFW